tara:strand:+ start:780 stop:1118 length:339 start_codon:yes stop_codon:yes gene_type:complete
MLGRIQNDEELTPEEIEALSSGYMLHPDAKLLAEEIATNRCNDMKDNVYTVLKSLITTEVSEGGMQSHYFDKTKFCDFIRTKDFQALRLVIEELEDREIFLINVIAYGAVTE